MWNSASEIEECPLTKKLNEEDKKKNAVVSFKSLNICSDIVCTRIIKKTHRVNYSALIIVESGEYLYYKYVYNTII